MSAVETDRLSGIKAIRKVVNPSLSLRNFLSTARLLAEETEVVPTLLDPLVYAAESLRVTIFERRLRAGREANELIRKVHTRMESPTMMTTRRTRQPSGKFHDTQKKRNNPLPTALRDVESLYVEAGSGLVVRANAIVPCTKPSDGHFGTELALVIDAGSGASALEAQRDLLLDAVGRMVAGRKLRRLADDPIEPLQIPFMHVPLADDYHRKDFIELLSSDLPVHGIEIGADVKWKLNTVSYPED